MNILCFFVGAIIIILLLTKIIIIKKNLKSIMFLLEDHILSETNTIISVSTGDRHIKEFANQLNIQLIKMRKQRQKYLNGNQEIKDTMVNISHDLRTPLTAISGYVELLKKENNLTTIKRYVDLVFNRVEIMKQLTEQLFQYSLILNSEVNKECENVNINKLLEESIAGLYITFKSKNIVPIVNISHKKIFCYTNKISLSRVFLNILYNALKYSDGDLYINIEENGEITFKNKALNLSTVEVGKLFERFYSVENGRESTGLGLEISKKLIEQMGGAVFAKHSNSNLYITIILPLSKNI